MKSKFTKGVVKGLLYYSVGFIAACLIYLTFGWEYKHAPGLHHIAGLLFLLGGAGWILYSLSLIVAGFKTKVNFGLLTSHAVIIISIVLYIVIGIQADNVVEYKTDPANTITINREPATNTASVVNGNGDTLYSIKVDSVLIGN